MVIAFFQKCLLNYISRAKHRVLCFQLILIYFKSDLHVIYFAVVYRCILSFYIIYSIYLAGESCCLKEFNSIFLPSLFVSMYDESI